MTTIFTTRLLNVLAVLAPVVLALRRPRRRPDLRRCSVRRCVQWWRWPVSSMADAPACPAHRQSALRRGSMYAAAIW